jgi:hypothetical protein
MDRSFDRLFLLVKFMSWQPIDDAPFDRDLELAVIDTAGIHSLIFPCRRGVDGGWVRAGTETLVPVDPTHWREWQT